MRGGDTVQTPFHAFIKARELENSDDLRAVYALSHIEVYPYQVAPAYFSALDSEIKTGMASKWSEVGA